MLSNIINFISLIFDLVLFSIMLQIFYFYIIPNKEKYSCQIVKWYYDPKYRNIFHQLSKRELMIIQEEIIGMKDSCNKSFENLKPKVISEIKTEVREKEAFKIYFKLKNEVNKINHFT